MPDLMDGMRSSAEGPRGTPVTSVAELPHGRVCVFARVRPMSVLPSDPGEPPKTPPPPGCVEVEGAKEAVLCDRPSTPSTPYSGGAVGKSQKKYTLDGIFDQDATQEEVYSAIGHPIVTDVLRGYHGCIMAYGQTGTGKTYNLLNSGTQGSISGAGLVPRVVSDLFVRMAADPRGLYEVSISMSQIYNDQVDDLLKPKSTNLQVKKDESGHCFVEGLSWFACKTPEFLLSAFHNGRKRLVYAETHLNKHSSRSHCVLQIMINRRNRDECAAKAEACKENMRQSITVSQTMGKLTIVDLAGSERIKKSHSEGMRFKEATNINQSLFVLGNVVSALGTGAKCVPYRESALTRLLEDSLGRMARTCMLVCLSPEQGSYSETHHTLEFAGKCMQVACTPERFEGLAQVDSGTLAGQLASGFEMQALQQTGEELIRLEAELNAAKARAASEVENSRRMRKVADESAQVLWGRVRELEEQLAKAAEGARRARGEEDKQRAMADKIKAELREAQGLLAAERQAAGADRESAAAAARLFGQQGEAMAALEGMIQADRARHKAEMERAEGNVARLESRLAEAASQAASEKEARAADFEAMGRQLRAAMEQLAGAQEQLKEAHEGWEETQEHVKELQADKADLLGRLGGAEEALAAEREAARGAEGAMREATAGSEARMAAEREGHAREVGELRQQLAEARAAHAEAARENASERSRLMDAAEKSQATAALLVEATRRAADSDAERSGLEMRLQQNSSELAVIQAKLEEGSKEREALHSQREELQGAREALQRQVAEARAAADELQQQRAVDQAAYEAENAALRGMLEEMRARVGEVEEELGATVERASSVEHGLEAARKEERRLQEEVRARDVRLAQEAALAQTACEQQAALSARLSEQVASVERHSQAASSLTQQLRETREQLDESAAALERARAEATEAASRYGALEEESSRQSRSLDSVRRSLLHAGVVVTKHGRNGKPYQRYIRCSEDGSRLEWAKVDDCKRGMGIGPGTAVTVSASGDRTVLVQAADRILTLQLGSSGACEASKVLWAEALASHCA